MGLHLGDRMPPSAPDRSRSAGQIPSQTAGRAGLVGVVQARAAGVGRRGRAGLGWGRALQPPSELRARRPPDLSSALVERPRIFVRVAWRPCPATFLNPGHADKRGGQARVRARQGPGTVRTDAGTLPIPPVDVEREPASWPNCLLARRGADRSWPLVTSGSPPVEHDGEEEGPLLAVRHRHAKDKRHYALLFRWLPNCHRGRQTPASLAPRNAMSLDRPQLTGFWTCGCVAVEQGPP